MGRGVLADNVDRPVALEELESLFSASCFFCRALVHVDLIHAPTVVLSSGMRMYKDGTHDNTPDGAISHCFLTFHIRHDVI